MIFGNSRQVSYAVEIGKERTKYLEGLDNKSVSIWSRKTKEKNSNFKRKMTLKHETTPT